MAGLAAPAQATPAEEQHAAVGSALATLIEELDRTQLHVPQSSGPGHDDGSAICRQRRNKPPHTAHGDYVAEHPSRSTPPCSTTATHVRSCVIGILFGSSTDATAFTP